MIAVHRVRRTHAWIVGGLGADCALDIDRHGRWQSVGWWDWETVRGWAVHRCGDCVVGNTPEHAALCVSGGGPHPCVAEMARG